jgi:hypothetical protein
MAREDRLDPAGDAAEPLRQIAVAAVRELEQRLDHPVDGDARGGALAADERHPERLARVEGGVHLRHDLQRVVVRGEQRAERSVVRAEGGAELLRPGPRRRPEELRQRLEEAPHQCPSFNPHPSNRYRIA